MPQSSRRERIFLAIIWTVLGIIGILTANYKFLWNGDCRKPERYRIASLRGSVVGRSLGPIQYRWLRRLFTAHGTALELLTEREESRPKIGPFATYGLVDRRSVDTSGRFDFGELPPNDYMLGVQAPGEDSFAVHFTIDPSVHNAEVLIDASPGYYCRCCGWDFEPH